MTGPLERDPTRIQGLAQNGKQRAEEDAKNVHVNLSANNSSSDLGRSQDVLLNHNTATIEAVKENTRSAFSTVLEAGKSYFRALFPENDGVDEAASADSGAPVAVQPTVMQKPNLAKPGYHTQSSTHKLLNESKNIQNDNDFSMLKIRSLGTGLMKAVFAVLGRQANLREESTRINQDLIHERGEKHKRLIDDYVKFKDRAEERKETAEIFGWTGFGAGLLGGVFAIGGIIATIASGGTALPVVLGIGAGIAGVASGGSKIAEGVFKYQSDLDSGEAFKVKQDMQLISSGTQTLMQEMDSNDNGIAGVWSQNAQLLRNRPNFFRN